MAASNTTAAEARQASLDNAWLTIAERLSADSALEDRTLAAASMAMILASGNGCSDKILSRVVDGLVAAAVESPPGAEKSKAAALNNNAASTLEAFVGQTSNVSPSSFARALVKQENLDRVFETILKAGDEAPSLSTLRSGLTYITLATFLTTADTPGVADVAGIIFSEMVKRDCLGMIVSLTQASRDPELRVRAADILGAMLSSSAELKKNAVERHVCKELMENIVCERSTFGVGGDNLGPALAPQMSKEDQERRQMFDQYHAASDDLCLTCVGMLLDVDPESAREVVESPAMVGVISKMMGQGSHMAKVIFQALATSEYKTTLAESMRQGAQLP